MYFDALTLAAVADELRDRILGGRVQRVLLTGELSIGFEIYAHQQRYQLLASAHSRFARVHLVRNKLSRGLDQVTPLLLLLRKYVLGSRIVAIEQPPLERLLVFSIVKDVLSRNQSFQTDADVSANLSDVDADEAEFVDAERSEAVRYDLIIEPMERRSNIILVGDDNLIIESVKRVTPRMSRRVILPRRAYETPPSQSKRDPRIATAAEMQALREIGERDLARALVAAYRGLSPQAAREVVFRALGRASAAPDEELPWYTLAAHLRGLFGAPWEPTLASDDDELQAYAPYALTHLANARPAASISAALEAFYAARETVTSHRQRRDVVAQQLGAARERLRRQHDQIQTKLNRAADLERLCWEGEMIFAFMHTLVPGQTTLEAEGETIALDPAMTPVENAQARFRAYDKARSALAELPERLKLVEMQQTGLEQLIALLELTDDRLQIDQIAAEAVEQGYVRTASDATPGKTRRIPRVKPLRLKSSDGFDIYVGRSASQNDEVTFRIARMEDLWLHVRTIHGAHVIIRSGGREVPERTILEAAGVAAYFSQARSESVVDIDLSRRSQVRKVSGGPPGLATYQAERTLRVAPRAPWA